MDSFIALKVLSQLLTPPGLLVVGLAIAGLCLLLRMPRLATLAAALAVAQAVLFSMSFVGDAMLAPLEDEARAEADRAPSCCYDAIVVLGAGVVPAAPPLRPDPELTDSSDRLWRAALLYRRNIAPRIIVSGGSYAARRGERQQTEAEAMREILVALGVPADRIVMEDRSLNTIDNIREVRDLVGAGRVALVTSAHHMPRALRLARKAGLDAEAFPADWRVVPSVRPEWQTYLPSVEAMWSVTAALREYIALALDYRSEGLRR